MNADGLPWPPTTALSQHAGGPLSFDDGQRLPILERGLYSLDDT